MFSQVNQLLTAFDLPVISQAAATAFISTLWQSLAIALGLGLSLKLAPLTSSKLRFGLWSLAFSAILLLPFFPNLAIHGAGYMLAQSPAANAWLKLDIRWSLLVTAIWACASSYKAVELICHGFRLRRLWITAQPVSSIGFEGNREFRSMQVCTTDELDRPGVIGFFRPRVLIPEWLLDKISPAELHQILMHESEHLSRYDNWTNLLQKLALVLFPLNPGLWWIERQLCLEREMACDEAVVSQTNSPRSYATCLTDLAERSLNHRERLAGTLTLGAWQHRSELARRIHRLLTQRSRLTPAAAWSIALVLSSGLMTGAVELSRCPTLVTFVQPSSSPNSEIVAVNNVTVKGSSLQHEASQPRMINLKAVVSRSADAQTGMARAKGDIAIHSILPESQNRFVPYGTAGPASLAVRDRQNVQDGDRRQSRWIVLTTWEQTTISSASEAPAQARTVSAQMTDFGGNFEGSANVSQPHVATGQSGTPINAQDGGTNSSAPTQSDRQGSRPIVITQQVTRLVFLVTPGNRASTPERSTEDKSASALRSKISSTVTATLPDRSGWLIFKL